MVYTALASGSYICSTTTLVWAEISEEVNHKKSMEVNHKTVVSEWKSVGNGLHDSCCVW